MVCKFQRRVCLHGNIQAVIMFMKEERCHTEKFPRNLGSCAFFFLLVKLIWQSSSQRNTSGLYDSSGGWGGGVV